MPRITLAVAALLLLAPQVAGGQEQAVATNLPADGYVDRRATIDLSFSSPVEATERVAVFVGGTDLTDLFHRTAGGMTYTPGPVPLPSGEHELVVYRVESNGEWSELLRSPLRVRTRGGFDRSDFDPNVTLGLTGPLSRRRHPDDGAAGRRLDQEFTAQLGFSGEVVRAGTRVTAGGSLVGASDRKAALRFRERGPRADKVDLSSYGLRLERERWQMDVGHFSHGDQRHLISAFGSRGTQVSLTPHPRISALAAVMNGSRVVGWDNLLGLDRPEHRIVSAAVAVDVLQRPGALRVEMTGLEGSLLPIAGFGQGAIVDAESSRGLGVRVQASTAARRLTLDAGFAHSAFSNPEDPTLAQGSDLVPVRRESRSARYLETSVGLLRGLRLSDEHRADLTLSYRHERVDPLYRSVAAYTRSDVLQNSAELRAAIAGAGLRATWHGSENNLDRIPSILTSRTRRHGIDATLPLAAVMGIEGAAGAWLPSLRYAIDRTHQFGLGVPEEGGFDESHVPDQVSLNWNAAADWRWSRVTVGLQYRRVHQDNRQPGRETADFTTRTAAATLGLPLHRRFSVNLSTGDEDAEQHEIELTGHTRRYGAGFAWNPAERSTLTLNVANTRGDDSGRVRLQENLQVDAQWSAAVPWLRTFGGTYFLRYSRADANIVDREFGLDQETGTWALNSGLNFSF